MVKVLDKIFEDYKGALQRLEEYDRQELPDGNHFKGQTSREMFWQKAWSEARKYDTPDRPEEEFQRVTIPKAITSRLEDLRDSYEMTLPMWCFITGILEAFALEYEGRKSQ